LLIAKKIENTNPTIEFIKTSNPKEILFVALSHPHFDHYSGMLELLKFFEDSQINIKYFIHTCYVHPKYLKWHEIDDEQSRLLSQIFSKVIELKQSKLINYIGYPTLNWQLKIGEGYILHCISPSDTESRAFTKQINMFKKSNELKCSQASNLLSSVFVISNAKISILLTADAEKQTFERLHQENNDLECLNNKLVLGQIPHHGSINNHYSKFWKKQVRIEECFAVISVGENKQYNFPHQEVVKAFKLMDYTVYATNHINGLVNFETPKEDIELSLALDMDSEIIEAYQTEGDQSFLIAEKNAVSIL